MSLSSLLMFATAYRCCTWCHWLLCHETLDPSIPGYILCAMTKELGPCPG